MVPQRGAAPGHPFGTALPRRAFFLRLEQMQAQGADDYPVVSGAENTRGVKEEAQAQAHAAGARVDLGPCGQERAVHADRPWRRLVRAVVQKYQRRAGRRLDLIEPDLRDEAPRVRQLVADAHPPDQPTGRNLEALFDDLVSAADGPVPGRRGLDDQAAEAAPDARRGRIERGHDVDIAAHEIEVIDPHQRGGRLSQCVDLTLKAGYLTLKASCLTLKASYLTLKVGQRIPRARGQPRAAPALGRCRRCGDGYQKDCSCTGEFSSYECKRFHCDSLHFESVNRNSCCCSKLNYRRARGPWRFLLTQM